MRATRRARVGLLLATLLCVVMPVRAEDGYDLWLRYRLLDAPRRDAALRSITALLAPDATPTQRAARDELRRGLQGLLATAPEIAAQAQRDGALLVGTPASLPQLRHLRRETAALGREGYLIRSATLDGHAVTLIAADTDQGALYGVFGFLRLLQTGRPLDALDLREVPRLTLRMLDHWDNLDRTVERGYSGQSLWDWHTLPDWRDPRYADYARANASIGINGTVLNNVNTNALSLTPAYLDKAAALADEFRPYGIRVYLSARFSAPIEIGGLATADPLDPAVRRWWRTKVDEIYARIPDFGGFLVKANSEGQPGPQDYRRTHADGANLLADALAPHDGVVIWRAFVYSNEQPEDRARQAYSEFVPLDGSFRANVLVQVKNGAIDFQPREPFHPLFGAMPKTPLMMEFQITKEYLGFATHLVYLGALYEETLRADTWIASAGSSVARVIDGSLHAHALGGMAGVANTGTDRTWSGSHFDQANWYAFGRLAWNPYDSAEAIAADWVRMTFSRDPDFVAAVVAMMMASREAVVDYMTPLGLHHLMGRGHHYGPGPWVEGGPRADWTSVYYHRATPQGIGFDRSARGSNAVAQYAPPLAAQFGDARTVPEEFLLWFHHLPWDWTTRSGRTLWNELVYRYDRGVASVARMRSAWSGLRRHVDAERHAHVAAFLAIQEKEARWWRDASLAYFHTFAQRPFPAGHAPPSQSLEFYRAQEFPHAPGHW
jgi:alpha-glucuronidase